MARNTVAQHASSKVPPGAVQRCTALTHTVAKCAFE